MTQWIRFGHDSETGFGTLVSCPRGSPYKSRSAASGWPGATREQIGHLRPRSNAARRDAPPGNNAANYAARTPEPLS